MDFGPRIDPGCRSFDFTLLFEDAFFSLLPAALFLVLIPPRLRVLWRVPIKLRSYRLAIVKLVTFLITPPQPGRQAVTDLLSFPEHIIWPDHCSCSLYGLSG